MEPTKNFPRIALGTWSWGVGAVGGDQVFGNHLGEADLKAVFDTAMKEGLKRGFRSFDIYAAAQGRRLSHTIANIQCLNYLKENGASGRLTEAGETVFLLRDETVEFVKEQKGFLSLFSLGDRAEGVTIRNMKYLLDRATVTNAFPVGVSNEFIGEAGSVTVESGTLLVIVGEM